MTVSIFLAKLLGPLFLIACVANFLHKDRYTKGMLEIVGTSGAMIMIGMMEFSLGLTGVILHNIWTYDWRVIITLLTWAALIEGAIMLLWPDMMKSLVDKFMNLGMLYNLALALGTIIGIALIYYGYFA